MKRDDVKFSSFSTKKNDFGLMFRIVSLLIHIVYLHFVIIVDHYYGESGIRACNVEVSEEQNSISIRSTCEEKIDDRLKFLII